MCCANPWSLYIIIIFMWIDNDMSAKQSIATACALSCLFLSVCVRFLKSNKKDHQIYRLISNANMVWYIWHTIYVSIRMCVSTTTTMTANAIEKFIFLLINHRIWYLEKWQRREKEIKTSWHLIRCCCWYFLYALVCLWRMHARQTANRMARVVEMRYTSYH